MLRIYPNLCFEIFYYWVKCYISSLFKSHINTVDTWSKLEEIIWYLNSMAFDHKKNILSQQSLAMAPKMVGIKYSSDIVICTFGYYATSRIFYNRLRGDLQLPSLVTLIRITSKASKLKYLYLILLIQVKRVNNSPWGSIYIKNVDISWQTTIWWNSCQSISTCSNSTWYNVHMSLTKLIPISKLTSAFSFEQNELTVQAITSVPVDVKAIMWWQPSKSSFFWLYPILLEKPCLTENNKH